MVVKRAAMGKQLRSFSAKFSNSDNTRYMSHVHYIEYIQIKSLIFL